MTRADGDRASETMRGDIERLGPWFHNIHLPFNLQTAPDHVYGDFPAFKWRAIADHIPVDLSGWNVLDIGCNAGFYSFELARRGAQVTGVDVDNRYLAQARWAARQLGLDGRTRFERRQIYELPRGTDETYDLVLFMGILYHLRYPLLGLEIACRKTRRLLLVQTMSSLGEEIFEPPPEIAINARHLLDAPGWPQLKFIEHSMQNDWTNWWVPNHACVLAMLRSCGMKILNQPAHETYLCEPVDFGNRDIHDERAEMLEAEFRAAVGLEPKKASTLAHERPV